MGDSSRVLDHTRFYVDEEKEILLSWDSSAP